MKAKRTWASSRIVTANLMTLIITAAACGLALAQTSPAQAPVQSPPTQTRSPASLLPKTSSGSVDPGSAPVQSPPAQVRALATLPPETSSDSAGRVTETTAGSAPVWPQVVVGLAWPITIILILLFLAFNSRLARLLGLSAKVIRKIKAGGVEMEISADAVDQVRAHFRASFDELVDNARTEYDRMAELRHVYEHLERAITVAVPRLLAARALDVSPVGLRATVHVKDIVFCEYLYQLVDYFPSPSGAGRRFSQRYGIIGRSWRLGRSLGEGDAFGPGKVAVETLIEEWGMLRQEAHAQTRARPSYLSVILRSQDDNFPIGILFVDSTARDAFGNRGDATDFALSMENTPEVLALARAVEQAIVPLQLAAPNIDIGRPTR